MSVLPPDPQNLGAEEDVLGASMIAGIDGPDASRKTLAAIEATGLRADHFYRESHGLIFAAALRLGERGEPTSPLMLEHELRRSGQLDSIEDGARRLHELAALVPARGNAPHHAKLVIEAADRRELADLGRRLLAASETGLVDDALRDRLAQVIGGSDVVA
jgi:replicative DNA helicase